MSIRFSSRLRELRVHLCQAGAQSAGVRDFITKHYVELKKANPKFPILIRESTGVQPRLWARYEMGKESSVSLTNKSAQEVLEQIKTLATK